MTNDSTTTGRKSLLHLAGSRHATVATLTAITGFYYLFVAITNCTDTETNRRGVAAVFSMESTIHSSGTDWRAIADDNVALVAYIVIVMWEILIAVVLLAATAVWFRAFAGRIRRTQSGIEAAKLSHVDWMAAKLSSLGWTMAVLLFAGGFLTVGGEWFRMWANEDVDATSAALQNFLIAAVGLILVHLPNTSGQQHNSTP